jgi:hypothetical protein
MSRLVHLEQVEEVKIVEEGKWEEKKAVMKGGVR